MGGGGSFRHRFSFIAWSNFFFLGNLQYFWLTFHLLSCRLEWKTFLVNFFHLGGSRGGLKKMLTQDFQISNALFELCWPNTSPNQKVKKTKNVCLDIIFHKCGLRFDLRPIFWPLEQKMWFSAMCPCRILWNLLLQLAACSAAYICTIDMKIYMKHL